MKTRLDVVNATSCVSSQICTFTAGKDVCTNDYGGPLLYTDAKTGILYLIGIISTVQCGSSNPSISTRVTDYLDWIENNALPGNFCRK